MVPALFIFADPHSQGDWVDGNPDPSIRSEASAYSAALSVLTQKQESAVKAALPGAKVVTIPRANHYVFLSNEAEVLEEMRAFVATLQ